MKRKKIKFAPRDIFEQGLEWFVMPTFDLVIKYGNHGVLIVKRKITPYKYQWAIPGLRQYKGERIKDVLARIARDEVGLAIDTNIARILGQYDGFFQTRQDVSTGYFVEVSDAQPIKLNTEHFSLFKLIKSQREIPNNTGAMYKFYLGKILQ